MALPISLFIHFLLKGMWCFSLWFVVAPLEFTCEDPKVGSFSSVVSEGAYRSSSSTVVRLADSFCGAWSFWKGWILFNVVSSKLLKLIQCGWYIAELLALLCLCSYIFSWMVCDAFLFDFVLWFLVGPLAFTCEDPKLGSFSSPVSEEAC